MTRTAAGNQTALLDANGIVTNYTYDLLNRLTAIDYPAPDADVTFTYNVLSERTQMVDGAGTTTWDYDLLSRPLTITQPFTGSVVYIYDSASNELSLKYPDGKVVTNIYDLASRLAEVAPGTGWTGGVGATRYAYDAANRMLTTSLFNGITSTYGYDGANRVVSMSHQTLTQTLAIYTYTLDAVGNRISVTETLHQPDTPPAADLIFTDSFESGSFSAWSSSTTDGGDLSVTSAAALIGTQGMRALIDDAINTIYVQDDTPSAETRYRARFYYDPNGLTMATNDSHTLFNGVQGSNTQVVGVDLRRSAGQYQVRASIRTDTSGSTPTSWFTISDDKHFIEIDWQAATGAGANNGSLRLWIDGVQQAQLTGIDNDTRRVDLVRLGVVSAPNAGTSGTEYFDAFESRRSTYIGPALVSDTLTAITYTYDSLYRLTNANYSSGSVFTYTYDAVGNRLSQTVVTVTTIYTYDIANRLVNAGGITYTWNNNGNLLYDGAITYTYDVANRLITATQGVNTYGFTYTGQGDRLRQTVNGAPISYTLDLNAGLTQVLADSTNTYLYGAGRIAQQNATSTDYFLPDALGSVRQLTTVTASVTLARSYQPFGTVLGSTGTGTTNHGSRASMRTAAA